MFDHGEAHFSVVEWTRAVDSARLSRLEAIAQMESSEDHTYDGFTSVTAFLIAHCSMTVRQANREVFLARSLTAMPGAVAAVNREDISLSQFEALAQARSRHPDHYTWQENGLIEAVSGLTAGDTRRAIDYWSQAHDPEGAATEWADTKDHNFLHASTTYGGRGRVDGELDPESMDIVKAALDSLIGEIVRAMPSAQLPRLSHLRSQALTEMARRHLDSNTTPTDHRTRPHMTVVVDWDTLVGSRPDGVSELINGTVIPPETARRLACDATINRLVTGPDSEILDLGRNRRTISPAQWRALRVRDRHCQFPGCRRPYTWCDAHHLEHWTGHDGPSDLCNLILLCRLHHTFVHERGWTIAGTPGHLSFTRPDGTNLPNAPPREVSTISP